MKILKTTSLLFLVMMFIGCSASEPKSMQPDEIAPLSEMSDSNANRPDNELKRAAGIDIPYLPPFMYLLSHSLHLYYQTTGQFPENMRAFVDSGFPLFWPRESTKKIPFYLNEDEDYIPSEELFGSFQYDWISPDKVELGYVYMDFKTYRETGEITWKVTEGTIPFSDKQKHISLEQFEKLESILVPGSEKRVDLITDSDTRLLYALCGSFSGFLESMTDIYHIQEGSVPSSFYDLLGVEQLVIKENFYNFAKMLESADAEFKWGFDNDKNTSYTYLKINGEVIITRCINYTTDNLREQMECDFYSLDISSPIITEKNITSIEIPEEYLISIEDIPVDGN